MFFCSSAGKWLKPVGKMGNAFGFCPGTDAISDLVGNSSVYLLACFDGGLKAFIRLIAQELTGRFQVKYITAEDAGYLGRAFHLIIKVGGKVIDSIKSKRHTELILCKTKLLPLVIQFFLYLLGKNWGKC